jgi:Transposase
VPAKLATRVRPLSIGNGRQNDDADAVSVGIAALTSPTLNTAQTHAQTTALRTIVDHRDDLVKTRTQTVNRLHVVLTHLVPREAGRSLGADHAADLLRGLQARGRRGQDAARIGDGSHQRGAPARMPHRQGRQRYSDLVHPGLGNRLIRNFQKIFGLAVVPKPYRFHCFTSFRWVLLLLSAPFVAWLGVS